jgi:hypothetical protein
VRITYEAADEVIRLLSTVCEAIARLARRKRIGSEGPLSAAKSMSSAPYCWPIGAVTARMSTS